MLDLDEYPGQWDVSSYLVDQVMRVVPDVTDALSRVDSIPGVGPRSHPRPEVSTELQKPVTR